MTHNDEPMEYDVYKHSPVRYLGYANELGEAFRAFLPHSVVMATYGVATIYALGDAADKGYKAYNKEAPYRNWRVADKTSDTLIWQMLASVTIPAFIINRTVHATNLGLNKFVSQTSGVRQFKLFKLIPTLVGLATIPVLPHVLDPVIDGAMDHTTRPLFKSIQQSATQSEPVDIE